MTRERESAEESVLADFDLASESGNERQAMQRVGQAVAALRVPPRRLERLQTAVAEATMNAIEHGNRNQPELPVQIRVMTSGHDLVVTITDQGGPRFIPEPATPDLKAKLAGLQPPRGWGLFLISKMVDEFATSSDGHHHTMTLKVHLPAVRANPQEGIESMAQLAVTMKVRKINDRASVIDIVGDITSGAEAALMDAYSEAAARQTRVIILNFTGLAYMNSGGIGLLVTLLVRANRQHQSLRVYGLSEHYRQIFDLTRLDEAIGIYLNEADALAGVASPMQST